MKFSDLKQTILAQFMVPGGNRIVPFIEGKPGGGKSACAREIVAELKKQFNIADQQIIEFNPSLRDPVDVLGIPFKHESGTHNVWLPPEEFYNLREGVGYCALIIEELTDAPMSMQNPMCRIILDRWAGSVKLSDKLFIIATGNRIEDKSGASRMSTKLGNRLRCLPFDENLDDWIVWARENKIDEVLIKFLQFQPKLLSDFDPTRKTNPTPRSWASVSLIPEFESSGKAKERLKISRDPSRSILGYVESPDATDSSNKTVPTLGAREIVTVLCMLVPFAIYAYGAAAYSWGFPTLIAFAMVAVIVVGIANRTNPNELAVTFLKGASAMGGICLMIGFAKVVGIVLTDGKILHTIAYAAVTVIGGLGDAFVSTGIFIFTTTFNLLIPSGPAKVPMLIPLFIPVADVLGITRQVLCLAFQLGDGLTNFVTPVSAVLAAALSMTGVDIRQWWRYVLPYTGCTFIIAIVALTILQSIGWN